MNETSDTVLDRARVREVAGVFRSRDTLDDAAKELLLAGFDRSDIDLTAGFGQVKKRLGTVYVPAEDLADIPKAPRRPFIAPEDITLVVAGLAAIVAFLAGGLAAFGVMASGGSAARATFVALAVGAAGGLAGAVLLGRLFRKQRTDEILEQAVAGGLVLWVRVRSPEMEAQAEKLLRSHGAEAVRVHEVEIEKLPDDLPLGMVRPDPWLGSEPLGRP